MAQVFTDNSKTILSIDFDRFTTCPQICDYCYVGNLERIYPAYASKLKTNDKWSRDNPTTFADTLNAEHIAKRKSKSKKYKRLDKLPVRIYGSGDFIPEHLNWIPLLDFKYYIISKSLVTEKLFPYIKELLYLNNLTKIILSIDNQNLHEYERVKHLYGTDRIGFAYTGMADDYNRLKADGLITDIFFNISQKKVEKEKSRLIKEQCPCDSGALAQPKSCSFCNKCWRSTITRGKEWNTMTNPLGTTPILNCSTS